MTTETVSPASTDVTAAAGDPPVSPPPPLDELRRRDALRRARRQRLVIGLILVLAVAGGLASLFATSGRSSAENDSLVFYRVRPRDFPVTVTERGVLESQSNVQVICEVDDVPGDSIYGTPILWLIENGTSVEKGDLVVELDASAHIERIDQQEVDTTYAQGQFIARSLDYDNRVTNNETMRANAQLRLETAKLELQQFEDEQGGTFQIALQKVEMDIQQREARHIIDQRNLVGTEHLHELGYKGKGDLAQARLKALQAQKGWQREIARRRELVEYDYLRSRLQLEGAVASAERDLLQTERNNRAALAQQKVWLKMAEMGKFWNEKRLARFKEQLEKCKIYAPQSGMVAYHVEASRWGSSSAIAEGVAVRYRQPILSIPDLKCMQVKTAVHESVIDSVKAGMTASVRLDAFPDRIYSGTIASVDVLPDPGGWLASDTKVYTTVVTIDEEVSGIKPGMTAVVEIHIDLSHNVLCIPIQAIVQRGRSTWCYVSEDGRATKRPLEIGRVNDKFAEVLGGLAEGDRVVLNTASLLATDPGEQRQIAPDLVRPSNF
jgi:RND family efflux transporter MFP subunit